MSLIHISVRPKAQDVLKLLHAEFFQPSSSENYLELCNLSTIAWTEGIHQESSSNFNSAWAAL